MVKPKISVVIPVFNRADCINRCLDSLINQSLKEIEVLVFDDFSTDNSVEHIRKYSEEFNHIILHKNNENIGSGAIRNLGVQLAKGKYILFVDSDDWIDSQACEILYDVAENNSLDILVGQYEEVYNEKAKVISANLNAHLSVSDGLSFMENNSFTSHAWNKLWLRDFILMHGLKNEEGRYYQDVSMTFEAFILAKRVASIDYTYYYYYLSNSTSVTRMPATDKHLRDRIWVILYFLEKMNDYKGTKVIGAIQMLLARHLRAGLSSLRKYKGNNKELYNECLGIISKALRKTGAAVLRNKNAPILKRVLIYLSPTFYLRIYRAYDSLKNK